jgi:nucleoside-diphosphate-sugar epimerase
VLRFSIGFLRQHIRLLLIDCAAMEMISLRALLSLIISTTIFLSCTMSTSATTAAAAAGNLPSITSNKPSVLVVGFGDLGERLAKLLQDDFQLVGLRRDPSKLSKGVVGLGADYTNKASLLAAIQSYKHLPFHYVIVTQTPSGWFNEESYQKHYVEATQHLLDVLTETHSQTQLPRRILYVSSIGVYDLSDQLITETTPTTPPRFNGKAVLEAERLVQKSVIPSTILRLAGLYGGTADGDGPHMDGTPPSPAHHPLARVAASAHGNNKLLSPLLAPNSGPSKLHRDDAAAALAHVLRRCEDSSSSVQDCYLVADAAPASNREVARWIADRAAAEGVEVPGLRELYLENDTTVGVPENSGPVLGKRCDSSLLRSEGWELEYPSFREGYATVYGRVNE